MGMWYYAFYAGVIAVLGALACQFVQLIGTVALRRVVAATSAGTVTLTAPREASAWPGKLASFLTYTALAFLTLMLGLRVLATGRPPYTNMWEYLVAFGWGTLLCHTVLARRSPHPAIGVVGLALSATLLVLPEFVFSSRISPLMPALQNNRLLAIHVALMLLSYSALAVAFGAALLYLWQSSRLRIAALPGTDVLDDLAYRAVLAGFPVLAAGIALGAYWASLAWGRYWGWDPKETTALVTWLVFAAYLHMRSLAKWRGTRAAWLVVVGFGSIIFNIFAVNFWIAGLHSYA